tara:strand:- start:40 stop:615 length:576 start_codon:yes stop_codon:yes gene_type:complete
MADNSYELDKYIERKIPELRLEPKPTLDEIICAFLETFEVYVKPITTRTRNIAGSAVSGAITGMAGADVGGDAYLIQGQNKQTAIQEWTKWKQWALSHPDFLDYKQEILFKYEDRAYEVNELIKTPEMKEKIAECKKQFHKEKKEEKKLVFIALSLLLGIPLAVALVFSSIASIGNIINEFQNKSNPEKIK